MSDISIYNTLLGLKSCLSEFKERQQNSKNEENARKFLDLWKRLAEMCKAIDVRLGNPKHLPVRELQFFKNITEINFQNMNFSDDDIESIAGLRMLENLQELCLSDSKFTKCPNLVILSHQNSLICKDA